MADIEGFLVGLFGEEVHAKWVQALANATLGAMTAASLAVAAIGHGLALARGGLTKHAIKQVDRLLSNPGIAVDKLLALWVPMSWGRGRRSPWPWIGRTSTPTARRRSCCRC